MTDLSPIERVLLSYGLRVFNPRPTEVFVLAIPEPTCEIMGQRMVSFSWLEMLVESMRLVTLFPGYFTTFPSKQTLVGNVNFPADNFLALQYAHFRGLFPVPKQESCFPMC